MTALKYIARAALPWSAKTIVKIYPCNLWATWRKVRISREKGASRGRREKGTIVTAYVLYCFDARGVIEVRYCFNLGSFLCIVVVLM